MVPMFDAAELLTGFDLHRSLGAGPITARFALLLALAMIVLALTTWLGPKTTSKWAAPAPSEPIYRAQHFCGLAAAPGRRRSIAKKSRDLLH
jgi:hypothetical protein